MFGKELAHDESYIKEYGDYKYNNGTFPEGPKFTMGKLNEDQMFYLYLKNFNNVVQPTVTKKVIFLFFLIFFYFFFILLGMG